MQFYPEPKNTEGGGGGGILNHKIKRIFTLHHSMIIVHYFLVAQLLYNHGPSVFLTFLWCFLIHRLFTAVIAALLHETCLLGSHLFRAFLFLRQFFQCGRLKNFRSVKGKKIYETKTLTLSYLPIWSVRSRNCKTDMVLLYRAASYMSSDALWLFWERVTPPSLEKSLSIFFFFRKKWRIDFPFIH